MNIKSPLQFQAYEHIKEQILTGQLAAGTLYSETKLSARLGISRTPMREALQCLSQDGYISIIPSKGFMIRQLNDQDMLETIQIRCAIEGFCTHLIAKETAGRKGQKLLKTLDKLLRQQEKALGADGSLQSFMEYDHQFHLALIHYADNREFDQIFQRLMYLIHLTTVSALTVPGRIEETLMEHREFYRLLEEGDGSNAYQLLIRHLMAPLSCRPNHKDAPCNPIEADVTE